MPLFPRAPAILPPSPQPLVLVGAAQAVHVSDFNETQTLNLTRQNWQLRAYGYYDEVGEVHFAARYVGNALGKIRLVGAERPGSESDEPVESSLPAVREAVNNLKSPRGGQSNLLRMMGINIFIAGECFLLGHEEDGRQSWEAVSINELEIRAGMRVPFRRRNPVETPVEVEPDTLVVRVWQPHPRYTGLADSSLRTVLDMCELLLLLTRADKAAARSRFAGAGLLFIPIELVPVSQQTSATGMDMDAAQNPVYQNLVESMVTPIKDEAHPSGVVPVAIFGPAEYGDKIKFLTFDRPQAVRAQQQREEAIQRIATAVDLPPEVLTGKADLNHWTAFQIHEETFQAHLQPMVELICDALTVGYLQPALREAGVDDWDKYVVWYDDSELVVRPNKSDTAAQLYAQNQINGAAWRRETGFAEEDVMGEDEYAKRIGILLQDVQLALTGKPTPIPELGAPLSGPGNGDSPTVKDKLTAPERKPTSSAPPQGIDGPATANKPKAVTAGGKQKRSLGMQLAQLDIQLMTQLRTSASEVLVRELDRAGARIRSKTSGSQVHKDLLADVPNYMVASVLGPEMVENLGMNDAELMKGAFSNYAARAAALLAAAQVQRNRLVQEYLDERHADREDRALDMEEVYGQQDRNNRERAMGVLLAGLLALGYERLYNPAPDAPSVPMEGEFDALLVPGTLVRETVEAAGGGTGALAKGMLQDGGTVISGYQWVYGPAIRKPFDSHEELDGVEFTSWDDDVLSVQPQDEWLGVEHYEPGDHRGCLCAVAFILDDESVTPSAE